MSSRIAGKPDASSYTDEGGLYSYLATPYNARGDVDAGLLTEYTSEILRSGVAGITCVASTCEGPYLTEAERNLVMDTVGKTVAGRAKLNMGVGAVSTRQVVDYAKRAKDAGATSLMLEMQQYFPVGIDAAYKHYETVASEVGVPIRLYNIPLPTHFEFTPKQIFAMGDIAAITSVKEATGIVTRLRDTRAVCGDRFKLYCGFHFQALDAFRLGADGWEAMLHPVIAEPVVELYNQLRADPWSVKAEKLYQRLEMLFYFFNEYGVMQSIRALSEQTKLNLGAPRKPLTELSPAAKARLHKIVANLNAA